MCLVFHRHSRYLDAQHRQQFQVVCRLLIIFSAAELSRKRRVVTKEADYTGILAGILIFIDRVERAVHSCCR